jgi:hypothetical protein
LAKPFFGPQPGASVMKPSVLAIVAWLLVTLGLVYAVVHLPAL